MNVAVIDLGVSNVRSLASALSYLGAHYSVGEDASVLEGATHAILPGVGAFDTAMQKIDESSLARPLRAFALERRFPLLGVCLGMQLLCESSEEGVRAGLGIARGRFRRLRTDGGSAHKVPHVGFSAVYGFESAGLFGQLLDEPHFYFTHSYALTPVGGSQGNYALCDHAEPFVAGFQQGNVCAVQFHPEKSQSAGLRLLSNFLELGPAQH